MEMWTVEEDAEGKRRWNKKPLAPFPLPEPENLVHYLMEHWQGNDEPHWVVFSVEEGAKVEKLSGPFNGGYAEGTLRNLVVGPLKVSRGGSATEMYVPAESPEYKSNNNMTMRLCIEFNRKV